MRGGRGKVRIALQSKSASVINALRDEGGGNVFDFLIPTFERGMRSSGGLDHSGHFNPTSNYRIVSNALKTPGTLIRAEIEEKRVLHVMLKGKRCSCHVARNSYANPNVKFKAMSFTTVRVGGALMNCLHYFRIFSQSNSLI